MVMRLMQGDEAIARGAMKAGLKFFAGYPITPASPIMNYLAKHEDKVTFVHTEDEIAAINMVLGASLAGSKAMTASSGPGISLKQEGIGMGHMAEIPLVVVNCMRVGPSTGMPTLPAQGDILQVRYGSHGDYYPIAFYPNSVAECYEYAQHAMNAAEEASCPVFVLADAYLANMYEPIDVDKIKVKPKKRAWKGVGTNKARHWTGLLAKDGVPATTNFEHYRKHIARLKKKVWDVADKYEFYDYKPNKKSDTLIISYGICSRVVEQFADEFSLFRPIRIFPVLYNVLKKVAKNYDKIICIEMNDGQYASMCERVLHREVVSVPILGGRINRDDVQNGIDWALDKIKKRRAQQAKILKKERARKKKAAAKKAAKKSVKKPAKKTVKKKAVKRKAPKKKAAKKRGKR